MHGFSSELRDKILGINAHMVAAVAGGAMHEYRDAMDRVDRVPGVLGSTPFIYTEVMLSSSRGVKGVVLRGVDPATADRVLALPKEMVAGTLADLNAPGIFPGIIVGKELADRLGLYPWATPVNPPVALRARKAPAGFTPKVKTFPAGDFSRTGMYEYDSSWPTCPSRAPGAFWVQAATISVTGPGTQGGRRGQAWPALVPRCPGKPWAARPCTCGPGST